jgi:hypothetical protein
MAWYLAKQRTTLLLTQILKLKAKSNLNQLWCSIICKRDSDWWASRPSSHVKVVYELERKTRNGSVEHRQGPKSVQE